MSDEDFLKELEQLGKTPEQTIQEGQSWYENALEERFEFLKELQTQSVPHPERNEIQRICDLPLDFGLSPEELEAYNERVVLADQFERGWRLFPCQANALDSYEKYGGVFGPIGVGWGKTLITLRIAHIAFQKGIEKILLLVPPNVYYQLTQHDIAWTRTKVTLAVPFNYMGKTTPAKRQRLAKSDRPGCYIFPWSLLSTVDSVELLESIDPGCIITDEAHYWKNPKAARTRRLRNHINKYKPEVVAVSGTITAKGLRDYYHILRACLADLAPVPLIASIANDWAAVINSAVTVLEESQIRPMLPLLTWARHVDSGDTPYYETSTGVRKAFQLRLVSSPGVVATSSSEIGTSLVIENKPVEDYQEVEGWNELYEFISGVEDDYLTPNGDEIDHAIHTYKWLFELTSGFYNALVWPTSKELATRKNIAITTANELLAKAKAHHEASQDYAKELRTFLVFRSRPKLDTPMLVGLDISKHGDKHVGSTLAKLYNRMKNMEFEGMPERDSIQVRVCPFKVEAAVRWAEDLPKRNPGALIWIYHQEIGKWVFELLQEAGLNSIYCEAGPIHNARILAKENRDKIIVASMKAHGEGKNLQAFQNQYFLQWPRSAKDAEQIIGRTHRNGQEADELVVHTNQTLMFDNIMLAACLNDALYIQQTTSLKQKLVFATWNPMPKIYSPEFLRERGMQNVRLSLQEKRLFQERFGEYDYERERETDPHVKTA